MTRTAIQSDRTKDKVAKLCNAVRGPYHILRSTGHGSYFFKKLYKPDSPERKKYDIRLVPSLPLSLKPCEPVDTTNMQYLSQLYGPLADPLKKSLRIELYNQKWSNKPLPMHIPPFTYTHDTLRMPTISLTSFISVTELHNETHTCPPQPLFEKVNNNFLNPLSLLSPYINIFLQQIAPSSCNISLKMLSSFAGSLSR